MTQQAELLYKRIDTLPPKYFGEVIDFVGYLEHKAQQETAQTPQNTREQLLAREREVFNKYAEEINREAMDVLKYQIPIFEDEDSE